MTASRRFEGVRVVVTGSSRGLGRALAEAFSSEGAAVTVNSRDASIAANAAADIGAGAVGIAADVSSDSGAKRLMCEATAAMGGLDILVNNAGINRVAPVTEMAPSEWREVIDLNLTGAFMCAHFAIPLMQASDGPKVILNVSSVAGLSPWPGRAAYATSKAGLLMLTRILAGELAPRIRVNAIAPAYIATDLVADLAASGNVDISLLERRTPLGRLASPAEVARAALFLCSSDAAYVTGETLVADGGWSSYGYV